MKPLLGLLTVVVMAVAMQSPVGVRRVSAMPKDLPAKRACTFSTLGYLESEGRTKLTDEEVGRYVATALRDGYVVTLYPTTERGLFVNADRGPR
jgi:hypothetical protein